MNQETNPNPAMPIALIIFTSRLATLVEQGIRLDDAFRLLEDCPAPYGKEAERLGRCLASTSSLAGAFAENSGVYSRYYIAMVKAGELGGVVDITLRITADVMTHELRCQQHRPANEKPLLIAGPSDATPPETWEAMSPFQRTLSQYLFCEAWGSLFASGVPILRTFDVVTELLPRVQRERLKDMTARITAGQPLDLAKLGALPKFVAGMGDRGEAAGTMDITLIKAAEALRDELEVLALG